MRALGILVRTSQLVGASSGRLAKVKELASLLRTLPPDELEIGVHYLSGEIRRGRAGMGSSVLRSAASHSAVDADTLSLSDLLASESYRDAGAVYVRPELVVEVAFSDFQASTRYPGGFALRLARVKRYREDKRIDDADTTESVRKIYATQQGAAVTPSAPLLAQCKT